MNVTHHQEADCTTNANSAVTESHPVFYIESSLNCLKPLSQSIGNRLMVFWSNGMSDLRDSNGRNELGLVWVLKFQFFLKVVLVSIV